MQSLDVYSTEQSPKSKKSPKNSPNGKVSAKQSPKQQTLKAGQTSPRQRK